jgi:methyl-accepting chemotaxis protein
MAKLTTKIAIPIILIGIFSIFIFLAIGSGQSGIRFYIIAISFAVCVFFFGLAVGQSFTSPIKRLLESASELSRGNLFSRADLETKDELAELANVFNKIAEELQASREQQESTEKSVGIKVKARTQELEETINALEQKVKNRTIELERLIEETNKLKESVKNKK